MILTHGRDDYRHRESPATCRSVALESEPMELGASFQLIRQRIESVCRYRRLAVLALFRRAESVVVAVLPNDPVIVIRQYLQQAAAQLLRSI